MIRSSARKVGAILATGAAAALVLGATALPAQADTPATPGCTTCVATFDTVGASFDFEVPANITSLKVTVAGGAGAAPDFDVQDPSATGGAGGSTVVTLGTAFAGQTIIFGVGGEGEGSYIQGPGLDLLAVAGGGGQAGYIGQLQFADQVFGWAPGGDGGSPVAAGVAVGGPGTVLGADANNGLGGAVTGGLGGTGDSNGSPGDDFTIIGALGSTLAPGGAGGTLNIPINNIATNHTGGVGGSGYTGGGGGAVSEDSFDSGDDILLDVVGAGGGGSGFLRLGLTAVAGDPNPGTGYVIFEYTVPALPSTGSSVPVWVPVAALLLLVSGAAIVLIARRRATN